MMRATRAQWAERVRRWRASGRTAREFAAREGLHPRTLQWWSSALRRAPKPPAFIELSVPVAPTTPARIEVVVREGVRIVVSGGFDAELLRQVVAALETR